MLTLPTLLESHLQSDVTSITLCWAVTRHNGDVLRGTAHDRDIVIAIGEHAGTYKARTAVFATDVRSTSDGAVSNVDVEGAFRVDASADDIRVEEIEGGLYDQAQAVLFLLNWRRPDDGVKILVSGTLGEFQRDSDGRYRSEVRGITQALAQQITRHYSKMCDVRIFGDGRCKLDVGAITRTGTVTGVTNRRRFAVSLDAGAVPVTDTYFYGSRLLFTAGANADIVREARVVQVNGTNDAAEILLWDEAPADIAVSDTISLPPACDKQYETCRLVHNNLVNFRGHGIYAVGRDALMRGATSTSGSANEVITLAELQTKMGTIAALASGLL